MNTYTNSYLLGVERKRKKEVRDFLFSFFSDMDLTKIVGLAGPNIEDYILFCKSRGFTEFEIYENDSMTAIHQLTQSKEKVTIKMKDIINANPDEPHTLYDLDYCATVRKLKEHIARFKSRFIMTFALRVPLEETLNTFFGTRNETIVQIERKESPIKHTEYITDKGRYIYASYRDTIPMCCFAKIS